MNTVSIILSIIAVLISLASFWFSVYKYRQSEKRRVEEESKAIIEGNFVKVNAYFRKLKIYNRGKGAASNIRFEVIDNSEALSYDLKEPIEMIGCQKVYDVEFRTMNPSIKDVRIKFIWDDKLKKDNEFVQLLQW